MASSRAACRLNLSRCLHTSGLVLKSITGRDIKRNREYSARNKGKDKRYSVQKSNAAEQVDLFISSGKKWGRDRKRDKLPSTRSDLPERSIKNMGKDGRYSVQRSKRTAEQTDPSISDGGKWWGRDRKRSKFSSTRSSTPKHTIIKNKGKDERHLVQTSKDTTDQVGPSTFEREKRRRVSEPVTWNASSAETMLLYKDGENI